MPRMSQELLDEFLQQPHVGVIATLRQDGRPYTVPVWWLWHEEAVWLIGTTTRVWCKQLKRDPRVSLCIEAGQPKPGHVGIDGTADARELPDFDIWPIARLLSEKFVGRGDPANDAAVDQFYENMLTEPRMLFRVEPEVWRAIDMSVYQGKRADREYQAQMKAETEA